jgi:hypothetical protein
MYAGPKLLPEQEVGASTHSLYIVERLSVLRVSFYSCLKCSRLVSQLLRVSWDELMALYSCRLPSEEKIK